MFTIHDAIRLVSVGCASALIHFFPKTSVTSFVLTICSGLSNLLACHALAFSLLIIHCFLLKRGRNARISTTEWDIIRMVLLNVTSWTSPKSAYNRVVLIDEITAYTVGRWQQNIYFILWWVSKMFLGRMLLLEVVKGKAIHQFTSVYLKSSAACSQSVKAMFVVSKNLLQTCG